MNYKEYIYNSSVVLNSEGSCTINCPGYSFAVKEREITNKLSIDEVKKRIDFVVEKLLSDTDLTYLILLPGNVLLEYTSKDIEEILLYACSKYERVQWELEKIDEKILNIFSNDVILDLLSNQKLFLNIGYIDGNLELLKNIFDELAKIGGNNIKNLLIEKGIYDDFKNKNVEEKFNVLKGFREEGKVLPKPFEQLKFTVFFKKDSKGELVEFVKFLGINTNLDEIGKLEMYGGDLHYDLFSRGLLFTLHSTMNQKIDKNGNNIWDIEHKKGYEECMLLNRNFEWSLSGDKQGTILPHSNPCINKISFGNMESSKADIDKSFKEHKDKVEFILIKNRYKKDFDQSELCRMCLEGEKFEVNFWDYVKYKFRQQRFITIENIKFLLKK